MLVRRGQFMGRSPRLAGITSTNERERVKKKEDRLVVLSLNRIPDSSPVSSRCGVITNAKAAPLLTKFGKNCVCREG